MEEQKDFAKYEVQRAIFYRESLFRRFTDPSSGQVDILGLLRCMKIVRSGDLLNKPVTDIEESLLKEMFIGDAKVVGIEGFSEIIWGYKSNQKMWDTLLDIQDQAQRA